MSERGPTGIDRDGPVAPLPAAHSAPSETAHAAAPRWRFQVVAEILNFAALRRRIGRARAAQLAGDLIRRIADVAPEARTRAAGRWVEIEFDGDGPADLDAGLSRLRDGCDRPFDLDGELHPIAVAFGAALAPMARADDVRLAEEAEAALIEARANHGVIRHDLTVDHPRASRRLASDLDRALRLDELLIQYQPKVHVRRQEITSAEALVRWRHPENGLIQPGDFIPAAEQFHVIDRLTLWTIRQVIADQRVLRANGHDLRIFINIAGQLLSDPAFVREACALVGSSDAKLGFEVTETSVIRDPQSAIANLQVFADSGVVIAIDDYGAGLSSLAYLKQLPARELKIDKLFVTQLTSSNRDPLIVRSTIDLAHALEMEVVAEGVETHAALALLTVMGCDMVQGFLISRPVGLDALVTFLAEDAHRAVPQDSRASFLRLAQAWRHG